MPTLIHRRVEAARRGEHPRVVERMASGWLVLGDTQPVRGYCLLLPDPVVPTLNDLLGAPRAAFLSDMAAAGDAVLRATGAVRINYMMLGNLEPALHAHVFPRFADEDERVRTGHPFVYDWAAARASDPIGADRGLVEAIRGALRERA